MFYTKKEYPNYTDLVSTVDGSNLYLPIEVDTEYTHPATIDNPNQKVCTNITIQVRAISDEEGVIYAHKDIEDQTRHKLFETDFIVWDYLRDKGYDVELLDHIYHPKNSCFPWIEVDCFAFFAVAEFPRILQGKYHKDYIDILVYGTEHGGIEQGRRLRTYTQLGTHYFDYINTSWLISLNGYTYGVRLSIIDTCAMHGITNYKTLCENSGLTLDFKDNFTTDEKSKMLEMYRNKPQEFDDYAKGDLYNYKAIIGNKKKFYEIYKSLGLEKYFTTPKLTIGATVARIVESSIKKLFDEEKYEGNIIKNFCKYGSADFIKRLGTTAALNAKVDGGRCRNNRPIDTKLEGVICDIDISGCYGEGLRVQEYPLGIPTIIDYPKYADNNKYLTLNQFLKKHGDNLVPGLWQARVSLKEDYKLKYQQDYLMSWIPPKDLKELSSNNEDGDTEQWWEIDNVGTVKIFKNEITNAIITHDFIQWLDNIASAKQRRELLDNLYIVTAMWYPKCERVKSISELIKAHNNHKGVNTCNIKEKKGKTKKVSTENMCHAWYSLNLGDLLVTKLLIERKKYPKKTPLNTLYKLCINTLYGDMVSPFFHVGNVLVGNNITARARALAWCMEKGFNGFQTITDGCAFDLNKVVFGKDKRKITGTSHITPYLDSTWDNYKQKPLCMDAIENDGNIGNFKYILSDNNLILIEDANIKAKYSLEDAKSLLNEIAWIHLQKHFKGLDILHKESKDVYGNNRVGLFNFEIKDFYASGTFHGSANYLLKDIHGNGKPKMRSYSKKPKSYIDYDEEIKVCEDKYNPPTEFLESLYNPHSINRSKVFLSDKILKCGDYVNNYNKYKDWRVYPGINITEARILREFSLSQFTFLTYKQYKSWVKEHTSLKNKYEQSYEMFYLLEDGKLDYQTMVENIEEAIREGVMKFSTLKQLKSRNTHRRYKSHIESEALKATREGLESMYRKD